jgi:hypothetical protein
LTFSAFCCSLRFFVKESFIIQIFFCFVWHLVLFNKISCHRKKIFLDFLGILLFLSCSFLALCYWDQWFSQYFLAFLEFFMPTGVSGYFHAYMSWEGKYGYYSLAPLPKLYCCIQFYLHDKCAHAFDVLKTTVFWFHFGWIPLYQTLSKIHLFSDFPLNVQ